MGMHEDRHGMALGCTTCWEVMDACPCGDSECDLLYCSCEAAHVAANPPNTCACTDCPSLVPTDSVFCGMCRRYMQVSMVSLAPAKARFVCSWHNTTTTMEDK